MKKAKGIFCLVLIFVFTVPSCRDKAVDIYTELTNMCGLYGDVYGRCVLYSDRESEGFTVSDGVLLGRLYTGKFEEPSCISRIEGFAIRLPLDESGFEIHIIKCFNRSDTAEIASLLMRRVDRVTSSEILDYAPETYEQHFRSAEVRVDGDRVYLLAVPLLSSRRK